MLGHALYGNGRTYYPDFGKKISRNAYFRNKVKTMLGNIHASQFSDIAVECDFAESNSKDLDYSLGRATFHISGTQVDGVWNLSATISDTYDFDGWRTPGSRGNNLNNMGLSAQYYGDLYPYYWTTTFEFNIKK